MNLDRPQGQRAQELDELLVILADLEVRQIFERRPAVDAHEPQQMTGGRGRNGEQKEFALLRSDHRPVPDVSLNAAAHHMGDAQGDARWGCLEKATDIESHARRARRVGLGGWDRLHIDDTIHTDVDGLCVLSVSPAAVEVLVPRG